MNQNFNVDNDLQKAIDDITNSTNGDPIFADPVAAPAPAPAPIQAPAPAPAPAPMPPAPMPAPTPQMMAPMPAPAAPAPVAAPIPVAAPAPVAEEVATEETVVATAPAEPFVENSESSMGVEGVKEAALRSLAPLLSKLDVPAEHKFDIYKNVIDNYHDTSVLEPAFRAASEISDDRERGEALLYIVDSIDNM